MTNPPPWIAAIRDRAEKATKGFTPGPVRWANDEDQKEYPNLVWFGLIQPSGEVRKADMDFIIAAQTDIPTLLAYIDVLREALGASNRFFFPPVATGIDRVDNDRLAAYESFINQYESAIAWAPDEVTHE